MESLRSRIASDPSPKIFRALLDALVAEAAGLSRLSFTEPGD